MSVNRNENIIKVVRGDNGIGPVRYEFPATLHLGGAGGGGASGKSFHGGAGGGGSTIVSASLNITPNVTYYINVGSGGAGGIYDAVGNTANNGTDGGASEWLAYNNNYDSPVTMSCEGGQGALALDNPGGNSGTGSVEFTTIPDVEDYPGFTGGLTRVGTIGGQPATAMGGGAGAAENGEDGTVDFANSGNGGDGLSVPSNLLTQFIAGGGGGGAGSDTSNTAGTGPNGGGDGGDNQGSAGTDATNFSAGGGGGGASSSIGGNGGDGFKGFAHLRFIGKIGTQLNELDITVTNALTNYDAGTNTTDILFEEGAGTFRYTAPYPYVPKT